MVLNVDDAIPDAAMDEIKAVNGIVNAYVVSLPQPAGQGLVSAGRN